MSPLFGVIETIYFNNVSCLKIVLNFGIKCRGQRVTHTETARDFLSPCPLRPCPTPPFHMSKHPNQTCAVLHNCANCHGPRSLSSEKRCDHRNSKMIVGIVSYSMLSRMHVYSVKYLLKEKMSVALFLKEIKHFLLHVIAWCNKTSVAIFIFAYFLSQKIPESNQLICVHIQSFTTLRYL